MADPVKVRRLTDDEGRKLQRLVHRGEGKGKARVVRYRRGGPPAGPRGRGSRPAPRYRLGASPVQHDDRLLDSGPVVVRSSATSDSQRQITRLREATSSTEGWLQCA